eukprot:COSAG02_NODE_4596_length_5179_cov_108.866535_5_plen_702_part_00
MSTGTLQTAASVPARARSPATQRSQSPEITGNAVCELDPEEALATVVRVGDQDVRVEPAQLEQIEPGSMLLAMFSSRWADSSTCGPQQLELSTGVEAWAVHSLLKEYAHTGILRRAEVAGLSNCRADPARVRALISAALYLGFSRLVPMVPDAPNALTWTELAQTLQRHTRNSMMSVNLACQDCKYMPGVQQLNGVELSGAGFTGAQLLLDAGNYVWDWSGATLTGASFSLATIACCGTRKPGTGLKLAGANLCQASFAGAYISTCDFNRACLKLAQCSGAWFANCFFSGANIQYCKFCGANIENCNFTKADLQGCEFSGVTFKECSFSNANLEGCNFASATLHKCSFGSVKLQDTVFTGCTFEDMYHRGLFCDLDSSSDLRSCDFRDCTFHGDLTGGQTPATDLTDSVDLDVAPFEPACGLTLDHRAGELMMIQGDPEHAQPHKLALTGVQAYDYTAHANLLYGETPRAVAQAVRRLDLSGCKLSGSKFDDCCLCNVSLSGVSLRGCSFRRADLRMASLNAVDASSVDFSGADFSFANLDGADLAGACLREASFWCFLGCTGLVKEPTYEVTIGHFGRNKQLVDPGGPIEHVHVDNLPEGASALVSAARSRHLLSVHWQDPRFTASRTNPIVAAASCEGTNFSEARLHTADLRGLSVRKANFRGAFLCYASLEGADITNAHFDGAHGPYDEGQSTAEVSK